MGYVIPLSVVFDSVHISKKNKEFAQSFLNKRVRVSRLLSKSGIPSVYLTATGRVVSLTQSCIVIERDDLWSGLNSDYKQHITYTYSDFLLGTYRIEEMK